ncbi:MAG: OmpA family protein [Candidatus Babeliales bacterium]|jgi:outer membrane protein OmpA-like peptidoglycan-associated protein
MEKMNKFGLLCVVAVLFAAGCGKKKEQAPSAETKASKKLVSANTPLKEETENLLDENVSDFAFVDDEGSDKSNSAPKVAEAEVDNGVAAVAEDDLVNDESDDTAAYAFKAVHFEFNKDKIRADQRTIIDENVQLAHQATEQGKKVVIEGHCDQLGSAAYNLALSQRRAQAIKEKMVNAGIAENDIKTIGYGQERPLVWSDARDRSSLIRELAPNRRAETIVN